MWCRPLQRPSKRSVPQQGHVGGGAGGSAPGTQLYGRARNATHPLLGPRVHIWRIPVLQHAASAHRASGGGACTTARVQVAADVAALDAEETAEVEAAEEAKAKAKEKEYVMALVGGAAWAFGGVGHTGLQRVTPAAPIMCARLHMHSCVKVEPW